MPLSRYIWGVPMLSVRFVYGDDRTTADPVQVEERRGAVTYELCRGLFLPEGVAALNAVTSQILAGGQWFQLWKGEIVSMASPRTRGCDGGIYRGPLVQEGSGRP